MTTQTTTPDTAEAAVSQASQHLYEALTHHFGPLDLGAHQPLVKAVSEYAERSREGDEESIAAASRHVYQALTQHFGPRDLGAQDPVVRAISEYGAACRRAGRRS